MNFEHTQQQTSDEQLRAQALSLKPLRPPTQIPGYEPRAFLGAGAYGEVWVALDRTTGRQVAIKFYAHQGGLDWSILSREVEKLAFLSADRYVVQLLDVGWEADPPYYVMEYIEQGSLEDLLKRQGKLAPREAVQLFREVAVGLMHAHGKGVLHCDLKPANVLMDQDGRPRIADFGQSRLSHEQTPALGTLFYMAPEQADLSAVPDVRWDVYALGALLYCMLTGAPPHRSESAVTELETANDLEDRLARYRQLLATSPPAARHRQVPGVDRELADIVDGCLAVDLRRRYANVQAVLDALAARERRRARRPLVLSGFVGPALLLAVVSIFAWSSFETVMDESDDALRERALDSNEFAAKYVAKTVTNRLEVL
jgi:serine/threonine protein kinase